MSIYIAAHPIAHQTAKRLKEELEGCVLIKNRGSKFNWERRGGLVINWGRSNIPPTKRKVFNRPGCIQYASNKIRFLDLMQENDIPAPIMLSSGECLDLLEDGKKVMIREPASFGGRGITIIKTLEEFDGIPFGKFAVQFFPKKSEFRAHVWDGKVIALTQKRARKDTVRLPDQRYVWNHSNGWVHCRDNVEEPEGIKGLAISAVTLCGLDFGAVDIMLNSDGELRVLEVNTAPGISGKVLDSYVEAIKLLR